MSYHSSLLSVLFELKWVVLSFTPHSNISQMSKTTKRWLWRVFPHRRNKKIHNRGSRELAHCHVDVLPTDKNVRLKKSKSTKHSKKKCQIIWRTFFCCCWWFIVYSLVLRCCHYQITENLCTFGTCPMWLSENVMIN